MERQTPGNVTCFATTSPSSPADGWNCRRRGERKTFPTCTSCPFLSLCSRNPTSQRRVRISALAPALSRGGAAQARTRRSSAASGRLWRRRVPDAILPSRGVIAGQHRESESGTRQAGAPDAAVSLRRPRARSGAEKKQGCLR